MKDKVLQLLGRLNELEEALANAGAFENKVAYREMTQEHAYISEIKSVWDERVRVALNLEEDQALLKSESEEELVALLKEEVPRLEARLSELDAKLENLLVPPDPDDSRSVIMEIRAGTGGD